MTALAYNYTSNYGRHSRHLNTPSRDLQVSSAASYTCFEKKPLSTLPNLATFIEDIG